MSKRINELINIIVGVSIGVFIGYGLYSFWDFKSHPELYAMQSAPWYTRLILWGAVTIGIVAIAAIIKLIMPPTFSRSSGTLCSVSAWVKKNGLFPL